MLYGFIFFYVIGSVTALSNKDIQLINDYKYKQTCETDMYVMENLPYFVPPNKHSKCFEYFK